MGFRRSGWLSVTVRTAPCRSISRGIANAADGDTIVVGPGRYGDLDRDGTLSEPNEEGPSGHPDWLVKLRSLFSGIYTVDNMDFVLRDAYMSGYSERAYDLDRLLRYSFFSSRGLTIHHRGLNALLRLDRKSVV